MLNKRLLKLGDQIRIRNDINYVQYYKNITMNGKNKWVESMNKNTPPGTLVTIKSYSPEGYRIYEDNGFYTYTEEMFDADLIEFLYDQIK